LETIYHRLFQDRGRLQAVDGNAAVLSALSSEGSMKTLVDSKISSPAQIDLKSELATFGLFVENFGLRTRISVSEQLTRQQRELLKDLGYNDVVRAPRK
jgi:hypothetical protein